MVITKLQRSKTHYDVISLLVAKSIQVIVQTSHTAARRELLLQ